MKTDCPSETLKSIKLHGVTCQKKTLTATDVRNAKTREDNHVITMRAFCEMVVLYLHVLTRHVRKD